MIAKKTSDCSEVPTSNKTQSWILLPHTREQQYPFLDSFQGLFVFILLPCQSKAKMKLILENIIAGAKSRIHVVIDMLGLGISIKNLKKVQINNGLPSSGLNSALLHPTPDREYRKLKYIHCSCCASTGNILQRGRYQLLVCCTVRGSPFPLQRTTSALFSSTPLHTV